jgi:hypothetical protein
MAGTPGIVLESRMKPQVQRSSIVITIDSEMVRNAGIDPEDPPEEHVNHHHNSGSRDGELVIDLKEAADGD